MSLSLAQMKSWLANLHDLETLRVLLPREQIVQAMHEFFNGGAEKAEWEEEAPRAVAKPQPQSQAVAAPKPTAEKKTEIESLINLGMDEDLRAALAEIE
jgi:hypothetical protein